MTLSTFKKAYKSIGQKIGAGLQAPTNVHIQIGLFTLGVVLLTSGILMDAVAQFEDPGDYNDERIAEAVNRIFLYVEGSFGALIMVAAGIGAIFSSAFGQYRAALALLIVAVGAFILRSLVSTFFNDESIEALR